MKHRFTLALSMLLCFAVHSGFAQLDLQCNGRDMHSLYFMSSFGNGIYRSDSVDTSPTDAIQVSLPVASPSLSINNNLNVPGGGESVYTTLSGIYHFWDGSNWVSTGDATGSSAAVNPGGSFDYIFNLDASGGKVYRYDGNGNSTLLVSGLPTGTCVRDLATDNQGNFYIFYTGVQRIVAYNPSGIPVDTFNTSGFLSTTSNGIAIIGDRIYVIHVYDLYEGIKTGNNINFTLIKTYSEQFIDAASCPGAGIPLAVFEDPEMPHFTTFPNPVSETLNIRTHNTETIRVHDCLGRQLTSIDVNQRTESMLDVSSWKEGVYFITAISENGSSSARTILVGGR